MKNIEVTPIINEPTIEAIVKEVSVLRESVIASVHQNKCDELCAIYHMIELNQRERERERLQAFTALVSTLDFELIWLMIDFSWKNLVCNNYQNHTIKIYYYCLKVWKNVDFTLIWMQFIKSVDFTKFFKSRGFILVFRNFSNLQCITVWINEKFSPSNWKNISWNQLLYSYIFSNFF